MYFLSIMPMYITVNIMKKILSFLFVLFFASQAFAPPSGIIYDCFERTALCIGQTNCINNVCKLTYEYSSPTCTCEPDCPPMFFDEISCTCDDGILDPLDPQI